LPWEKANKGSIHVILFHCLHQEPTRHLFNCGAKTDLDDASVGPPNNGEGEKETPINYGNCSATRLSYVIREEIDRLSMSMQYTVCHRCDALYTVLCTSTRRYQANVRDKSFAWALITFSSDPALWIVVFHLHVTVYQEW
jgi:hypothetical protein